MVGKDHAEQHFEGGPILNGNAEYQGDAHALRPRQAQGAGWEHRPLRRGFDVKEVPGDPGRGLAGGYPHQLTSHRGAHWAALGRVLSVHRWIPHGVGPPRTVTRVRQPLHTLYYL